MNNTTDMIIGKWENNEDTMYLNVYSHTLTFSKIGYILIIAYKNDKHYRVYYHGYASEDSVDLDVSFPITDKGLQQAKIAAVQFVRRLFYDAIKELAYE